MENFKQIKKSSDKRLKIMFEDVNKIIKKYEYEESEEEQPVATFKIISPRTTRWK